MMRMKLVAMAGLAAMLVGATAPAFAESLHYKAEISAANEVPPTGTGGKGQLTATYDPATKVLDYKVDYSGLTGAATMAHFHGSAPKGQNAGVMVPISGSVESPISGKATLTDDQAKALTAGMMYFNVHTAAHKAGEIRGQVEPAM